MKRKNLVIILMAVFVSIISCEDFLDQQPIGAYNEDALANSAGIDKLLVGAYTLLNGTSWGDRPDQWVFGDIRGGAMHKGSTTTDQVVALEIERFEVTSSNSYVQSTFSGFYNAIYRCNLVLNTIPSATDMTDNEKAKATAEARFLRGHYYFMLKRLFVNIPFIDETNFRNPIVPNTDESGNYIDIWPKIKEDFNFARQNLPETEPQAARPNQWAAEAYYAKVLIYMGNEGYTGSYEEALTVLNNVITNGKTNSGEKYALLPNYHDNFNADKENHVEWVWGVQHSQNDGIGTNSPNSSQSLQPAGTPNAAGPGRGWGFFQPSQWFVDHFRVDANGLPYIDMYETNPNSVKSDDGIPSTDPFEPETSPLDPRLDWSVGRRGIPFLDYGIYPGASWIREPAHGGPYMSKKWFTLKKDVGKYTYTGRPTNALNMPVIRFADVLLFAAEMEARVGDLDDARNLVNQVRDRMIQNSSSPDNWVKLEDRVTNAANYQIGLYPDDGSAADAFTTPEKALKAILFERMLELGLEGHRAYDLIRFGYDDNITDLQELNDYIAFESERRAYLSGAVYTHEPDRIMPIPQVAIDRSLSGGVLTLKQNPGY